MKNCSLNLNEYNKENINNITELILKFNEYYDKYQKTDLLICRSENSIKTTLDNNEEVSVSDMLSIKNTIQVKYNYYIEIIKYIEKNNIGSCIDVLDLYSIISDCNNDIFNIDMKVNKLLWSVEIKV
jgi:hypothetical protein